MGYPFLMVFGRLRTHRAHHGNESEADHHHRRPIKYHKDLGDVNISHAAQSRFGVHVSIAGSIDRAVDRARDRGCQTFQIFTSSPRSWSYRDIGAEEARDFREKLLAFKIEPAVAHMPYLPNLASPVDETYKRSVSALETELVRCNLLGIPYLVTHMGSHGGAGRELGIRKMVEAADYTLSRDPGDIILLLETTAGTRNSMGGTFQDIREVLEAIGSPRVRVCLDTCHIFAAGYDIRSAAALEKTLKTFDKEIGLDKIKLLHLNDCKGSLGSHLDRHEHIGLGQIGEEGFKAILRHQKLRSLPGILETPVDERRDDRDNLKIVRKLAGDC